MPSGFEDFSHKLTRRWLHTTKWQRSNYCLCLRFQYMWLWHEQVSNTQLHGHKTLPLSNRKEIIFSISFHLHFMAGLKIKPLTPSLLVRWPNHWAIQADIYSLYSPHTHAFSKDASFTTSSILSAVRKVKSLVNKDSFGAFR
jgi:hypothetical protein